MRRRILVHGFGATLAGLAMISPARAETWQIVDGELKGGKKLSGSFEASADGKPGEPPENLFVERFELDAGRRRYSEALQIVYYGAEPIVQVGSGMHFAGDRIDFFSLRSGGDLLGLYLAYALPPPAHAVDFRIREFRGEEGRVISRDGETGLPRRIEVTGRLYELTERYVWAGAVCPPSQPPPSSGGGSGGGVVVISDPRRGGSVVVSGASAVSGGAVELSAVSARRSSDATLHMTFVLVPSLHVPTLDELGVRAPDGADVALSQSGELTLHSEGDLFIEGTFPGAPIVGLTRVTITTPASVVVTGRIELGEAALSIVADQIIWNSPALPPPVAATCEQLSFMDRLERKKLGWFSLIASAVEPMKIDVVPRSKRNLVQPGFDMWVQVAILGSRKLDVRDVDPASLRLGRGEAEPVAGGRRQVIGRRELVFLESVNGDRHSDLTAVFSVSDAEVAFGDTVLCLFAKKRDGTPVEGCDEIQAVDTIPISDLR